MPQGVLGFKYEEEKHDTGMTGLAGLPVYLDLIRAIGLPALLERHLRVKARETKNPSYRHEKPAYLKVGGGLRGGDRALTNRAMVTDNGGARSALATPLQCGVGRGARLGGF